ncbi:hypothetical protein GGI12_000069 [Dipsacomyces acuminosporus]|nr:hypothetical protein GGI12_000069 [Dipsacomyces acuminosporus]
MVQPVKAKSPGAVTKEHHIPRNGGDARGLPKKEGAGKHNWGKEGKDEADILGTSPSSQPKIQTLDAKAFEEIKNATQTSV